MDFLLGSMAIEWDDIACLTSRDVSIVFVFLICDLVMTNALFDKSMPMKYEKANGLIQMIKCYTSLLLDCHKSHTCQQRFWCLHLCPSMLRYRSVDAHDQRSQIL